MIGASMSVTYIRASVKDRVLRVTIDRPAKRNALSFAVLDALNKAFESHAANDGLILAVLTGAGDKSFAAGGDLHELASLRGADAGRDLARRGYEALDAVRRFPVPVIGALNGDALGGGAELALACDLRIAAAHARIGFLQGRLNIATAWGGGIDLVRTVGPMRAMEILGTSGPLTAEQALECGLINGAATAETPFDAFVDSYLRQFSHQAPQVMRAFKAQVQFDRINPLQSQRVELERSFFAETWAHADHWRASEAAIAALNGRTSAKKN